MHRPSPTARGYGYRWRKFRAQFLLAHPLCVMCLKQGLTTAATVVDHIIPHRGHFELFWREGNHQALCKPHHDSAKASEEARGHEVGCGVDGTPNDPRHPWNGKPAC